MATRAKQDKSFAELFQKRPSAPQRSAFLFDRFFFVPLLPKKNRLKGFAGKTATLRPYGVCGLSFRICKHTDQSKFENGAFVEFANKGCTTIVGKSAFLPIDNKEEIW